MKTSWFLTKVMVYLISAICTIFFLLSSCTQSTHTQFAGSLADEERVWMNKFFHDLLIEEGAIYTLAGSKPVSRIVLYHYSDEQIQAYIDSLSEAELQDSKIVSDYDLPNNWLRWKSVCPNFPSCRFLLVEDSSSSDPDATIVYFVNILNTIAELENHYETFRRFTGEDFDPTEVVYEIGKSDSRFWAKVWGNSLLSGIVFGYGKENATMFHLKHFSHSAKSSPLFDSLQGLESCRWNPGKKITTLENFSIPVFYSFTESDPVIKKYEKEKSKIQFIYHKKNFLDTSLGLYLGKSEGKH